MANKNDNLVKAKAIKNDEFYTFIEDIEKEIVNYKTHLQGKIIYCNCDKESSNFWLYFYQCFDDLGIQKVIATHLNPNGKAYKLEFDGNSLSKTYLNGNGDFFTKECIDILISCDIVITNPPFSLYREYVNMLIEYNKKFLIIGSQNSVTYKDIFPLIRDNKMWMGINSVKKFQKPDKSIQTFGNVCWFTNLENHKRTQELILTKKYNVNDYKKYDNYDAINVNKVSDIPVDYYEVIGVPINFLDKYSPSQFEILGSNRGINQDENGYYGRSSYIDGQETFKRIFVRRKIDNKCFT